MVARSVSPECNAISLVILAFGNGRAVGDGGTPGSSRVAAFRAAFLSDLLARAVLVAGLFGAVTVGNGIFPRGVEAAVRVGSRRCHRSHVLTRGCALRDSDAIRPFRGRCAVAVGTLLGRKGIGLASTPDRQPWPLSICSRAWRSSACDGASRISLGPTAYLAVWPPPPLPRWRRSSCLRGRSMTRDEPHPAGYLRECRVLAVWSGMGVLLWWAARAVRSRFGETERHRLMMGEPTGAA